MLTEQWAAARTRGRRIIKSQRSFFSCVPFFVTCNTAFWWYKSRCLEISDKGLTKMLNLHMRWRLTCKQVDSNGLRSTFLSKRVCSERVSPKNRTKQWVLCRNGVGRTRHFRIRRFKKSRGYSAKYYQEPQWSWIFTQHSVGRYHLIVHYSRSKPNEFLLTKVRVYSGTGRA